MIPRDITGVMYNFEVDDSCEGPEGIEASWRFASHALRNGAGVAIHLSNSDRKDTIMAKAYRSVLSHSGRSILALNGLRRGDIKMVQLFFI